MYLPVRHMYDKHFTNFMAFSKFFKISLYSIIDIHLPLKTFKNQISDGIYHFLYVYLQYKNISCSGSNSIDTPIHKEH